MQLMNKFAEKYKQLTNTELLNIIENSEHYQDLAVEAAKFEINSRNLSSHDFIAAREEVRFMQAKKEHKDQINRARIDKVKNVIIAAIDKINPIQNSGIETNKLINLISVVLGFMAIYKLIKDFDIFIFLFSGYSHLDLSIILFFIPIILFPTLAILFWKRVKIGWILLCFYLSHSAINSIIFIIISWNMKHVGSEVLDSLFAPISPNTYLLSLLFFIGFLWVIMKNEIREKFMIKRNTLFGTVIAGILSSIVILVFTYINSPCNYLRHICKNK